MSAALPEIPRLYTAAAEWLGCMAFLSILPTRCRGWRLGLMLATGLVVQGAFLHLTSSAPVAFWVPCMLLAVGLMFLLLWLSCEVTAMDAAYYCAHAFVLAEFAASLEWQLHCFLWPEAAPPLWAGLGLLAAVYGAVIGLGWLCYSRKPIPGGQANLLPGEMASAVLLASAVFAASNLGFLSRNTPLSGSGRSDIYIIRTVIDACGLSMLFARHLQCRDVRLSRELEAVRSAMNSQYQQYQLSRETVELIDQKYHDLKHYIIALRASPDQAQRGLAAMEEDLRGYEAHTRTGNQVLDTILTSKNLTCRRLGISLTCTANGALLGFMDALDLSAVFGNALDNAIECETRLADPEKRMILLNVSARQGFVLIRVENFCEDTLSYREGLPRSTKGDPAFHGYGLKSIRYVAAKYGGTLTTKLENAWFTLCVLLPLPPA